MCVYIFMLCKQIIVAQPRLIPYNITCIMVEKNYGSTKGTYIFKQYCILWLVWMVTWETKVRQYYLKCVIKKSIYEFTKHNEL